MEEKRGGERGGESRREEERQGETRREEERRLMKCTYFTLELEKNTRLFTLTNGNTTVLEYATEDTYY